MSKGVVAVICLAIVWGGSVLACLISMTAGAIVASRGSEGLGATLLAAGLFPPIYYFGQTVV